MSDCITYRNTHYFSSLITDYLEKNEALDEFYGRFPSLENFKKQAVEKEGFFSEDSRKVLVKALENQYKNTTPSALTQENISCLKNTKTFTVTTGHQLNLFTGPLYFLYKIVSTIKLAQQLSEVYPAYSVVPVYWMATEDHDFDEINYFNYGDEKIQWKSEQKGPVGEFSMDGLHAVFKTFAKELNASGNAQKLEALFKEAYLNHDSLTDATRYIANELFGEYGLIIVDGNDKTLKREFIPYIKRELQQQSALENVNPVAEKLNGLNYKVQVNPREINLFYLKKGLRERIIKKEDRYFVNETKIEFSEEEILTEIDQYPERFSPNVIMRPLYQEVVLPNLGYIGGGGELAYWLELKPYFEAEKIPFPILLLRNSALLMTEKQQRKAKKLQVSIPDLFLNQSDLITKRTRALSEISIDFSPQKEHLRKQFEALYKLAEKTDESFLGAVAAQEKKQCNGLDHLEKRLLTAQKRRLKDQLQRLVKLQYELFPKQNLQERELNFSTFYEEYGDGLIKILFEKLDPLQMEFAAITL